MASTVVSLMRSATPTRPAYAPSTATNITVSPLRRNASARSVALAVAPTSLIIAVLPIATVRPSTVPTTPLPVIDRKSDTATVCTPRSPAPRTMASANGCSLTFSRLATRRSNVGSSTGPSAATVVSAGFPSVRVPVLSTTTVSTCSITSSASALRNRTPSSAPRPVPTMIDIGVARPRAHGHAMISTATALTSACARRGSGPHTAQMPNVATATSTTMGTNHPDTVSARR